MHAFPKTCACCCDDRSTILHRQKRSFKQKPARSEHRVSPPQEETEGCMWQIFAARRSAYWVANCWHQDDGLQTDSGQAVRELLWHWWNLGLLCLTASTTGIESASTLASSHLTTRLYLEIAVLHIVQSTCIAKISFSFVLA